MSANRVRTLRLAAGVTQAELARRSGVPQPNLSAYETGRREPSAQVLQRIEKALASRPSERIDLHREQIRALVSSHHASAPRVFGSVARGEDEPGSDVDILVDFNEEASLLDEIGLRLELQDLLQTGVDVVGADGLRGEVRDRVLSEAAPV